MNDSLNRPVGNQIFNVPNQISMVRLGLSIVLFVVMSLEWYWTSFVLFVLAAGTDWIDGWWARKYNQVSQLGRILDPFCDKILICGTFILLAVAMRDRLPWYASVTGWMAVVVVGREMLVTALRGFIEQSGGDFSAKFAGKLKMWFQCIAAGAGLVALAMLAASPSQPLPQWLNIVLIASIWLAVLSTVQSGIDYVVVAAKSLLSAAKSG
ncbi:MAG: CDP-diacylglycerol--glycerol-3-phosphate 3-phosphatidyltransferase [Pirellulaceae bacterium]